MALSQLDFQTIVTNQVTAIQSACNKILDFTIGSIMRSITESNAAVTLWLQQMILNVLALARASTSSGADLDSWAADFGFYRLPAAIATGAVTFSRFTATQQAVIPIGATVQTADGAEAYQVILDASNTAYNATQNGYVLAAGTASVTVPVQATVAAAAGNAAPNTVTVMTQAISGVDTVTNALQFINGADAETDDALRARFVQWVSSLSKATKNAVIYVVTSLGATYAASLVENQNYDGTANMGFFYVVVDDGTGNPSAAVLSNAFSAIDAVRPVATSFQVYAPVIINASASMTIIVGQGYDHSAVQATVQTAVQDYIDSLTLGQTLLWSKLAQVAFNASPGVADVQSVLLNGGTANLTSTAKQVIKYQTVSVTVGNQGS